LNTKPYFAKNSVAGVYRLLILSALLILNSSAFGQVVQNVRGKVIDSDTRIPIGRARVFLLSDSTARGIATNSKGEFVLKDVPTGRHTVRIQHKGHLTSVLNNVVVNSGKETVLNVKLRVAAYSDNEVTSTVTRNGEVSNAMAMVSAREYTVDETIRYAGSRGDPLRVALNFAGVQGIDDSRNDLVIRGNSPYSMAIQIDGVIIPNTNHFGTPGTNGGPLSKISFKALDNSDFYSGVMPAEFGNSTSGLMDLNLKTGNNQNHEQGIYLGVLGADIFVEGPMNREKGSSYLINYRYSTVGLFLNMGLDLGTSSEPFYQDLNFKFNWPNKKGGELSFWGLTGNSISRITLSDDTQPSLELYGDNDRDQFLESGLDVLGFTHSKPFNERTFLKTTLALTAGYVYTSDDYIIARDTLSDGSFNPEGVKTTPVLNYSYDNSKLTWVQSLNKRIGNNKLLKIGYTIDWFNNSFVDSTRDISKPDWETNEEWQTRWNAHEEPFMFQYFAQLKQEFGERLSATLGFHGTHYTLGSSSSLFEPRLGLRYNYAIGKTLAFGAGLYSQMQPPYMHYYLNEQGETFNKDLGLTKNWQAALSHAWDINSKIKFTAETYFQYLFDIPVEVMPSPFSMINAGAGFSRVFPGELENAGIALNYGLELTLQRFFDNGFSYLINGTVFESKYRGSDGVMRNTHFNGNYMFNALGTKEFKITNTSTVGIGTNITYGGGRRYGEFDVEASEAQKEVVYRDDLTYNENKYKDYFRLDIRANIVFNRSKTTHELAFDFINALNSQNVLDYAWAPGINTNSNFALREQIGFFPMFYYKLDF
jgi:hypothetical protein